MNKNFFEIAKKYIPGGVNSPVRSFNAVGGTPFFTKKALGAYLFDVENNRYLDYICSWGANIVGHANEYVIEKVINSLKGGFSYGTPTELEVEFAKRITTLMPNIEKLRLVSSGTEAVMSAIRLARGYTKKKHIIKFNGCYHGHSDNLLVKGGSGLATFNSSTSSSAGVINESVKYTLSLDYNNTYDLKEAFNKLGDDIACVIIEPFVGNMNLIKANKDFLDYLVKLCNKNNTLLIFDEVMTGFRVSLGGAQELLNIKPDLTILGKVIGGGMPLAAFGGKAKIMDLLSPIGPVYQAGTLSGNPIAVTSGLAILDLITKEKFYDHLNFISKNLTEGLKNISIKYSIPFNADYIGGMFGIYFRHEIPKNFEEIKDSNNGFFKEFFHMMLNKGIFFPPSIFEAGFTSYAHTIEQVNTTLSLVDEQFEKVKLK